MYIFYIIQVAMGGVDAKPYKSRQQPKAQAERRLPLQRNAGTVPYHDHPSLTTSWAAWAWRRTPAPSRPPWRPSWSGARPPATPPTASSGSCSRASTTPPPGARRASSSPSSAAGSSRRRTTTTAETSSGGSASASRSCSCTATPSSPRRRLQVSNKGRS